MTKPSQIYGQRAGSLCNILAVSKINTQREERFSRAGLGLCVRKSIDFPTGAPYMGCQGETALG